MSVPAARVMYAMTRDTIRFRHDVNKLAQHESRQSRNYRPLPAFNVAKTRCGTNPGQARNCRAIGFNAAGTPPTYTPPTTPGQTAGVVLNPAYMTPAMEPWNRADNSCTLSVLVHNLGGTLVPTNCQTTETQVTAQSNHTFQGSGRQVMNSDLGLNVAELTQRISLAQMRIRVHRNVDTHTYSYRYERRNTGTCSGASWSCGTSQRPRTCRCSAYSMQYWGAGSISGNCRGGCTANHGSADADGSYQENQHTWIEVIPDGPLRAEASFAIPYNYTITPQMNFFPANAERIQIGGTELSFAPSLRVCRQ